MARKMPPFAVAAFAMLLPATTIMPFYIHPLVPPSCFSYGYDGEKAFCCWASILRIISPPFISYPFLGLDLVSRLRRRRGHHLRVRELRVRQGLGVGIGDALLGTVIAQAVAANVWKTRIRQALIFHIIHNGPIQDF